MRSSGEIRAQVIVGLITILCSGNIFFVKRLVDKLDSLEWQVIELKSEMASVKTSVEDLTLQLRTKNDLPRRKNRRQRYFFK